MDLETENRIASILLKEAVELRRQAQQEGVLAYLHKPTIRWRPNSRFLNATIRGIEQANRVVEVDEMWRARQKELEMDGRSKRRRDEGSHDRRDTDTDSSRNRSKRHNSNVSCSSSKRSYEDHHAGEDNCLKDEELEEFLQSRAKRGRGSIGSRMDETGPYLPHVPDSHHRLCTSSFCFDDERPQRAALGPERPSSSKHWESSDDESEEQREKSKKSERNQRRAVLKGPKTDARRSITRKIRIRKRRKMEKRHKH